MYGKVVLRLAVLMGLAASAVALASAPASAQINKQSIRRLVPVWSLSLDNNWGEQAQPIIYNGVMYVTNARATVAIEVGTARQI